MTSSRSNKMSPGHLTILSSCFCKLYCVTCGADITIQWAVPSSPLCFQSLLWDAWFCFSPCASAHVGSLPPDSHPWECATPRIVGTCTFVLSDLSMINCPAFGPSLPLGFGLWQINVEAAEVWPRPFKVYGKTMYRFYYLFLQPYDLPKSSSQQPTSSCIFQSPSPLDSGISHCGIIFSATKTRNHPVLFPSHIQK